MNLAKIFVNVKNLQRSFRFQIGFSNSRTQRIFTDLSFASVCPFHLSVFFTKVINSKDDFMANLNLTYFFSTRLTLKLFREYNEINLKERERMCCTSHSRLRIRCPSCPNDASFRSKKSDEKRGRNGIWLTSTDSSWHVESFCINVFSFWQRFHRLKCWKETSDGVTREWRQIQRYAP